LLNTTALMSHGVHGKYYVPIYNLRRIPSAFMSRTLKWVSAVKGNIDVVKDSKWIATSSAWVSVPGSSYPGKEGSRPRDVTASVTSWFPCKSSELNRFQKPSPSATCLVLSFPFMFGTSASSITDYLSTAIPLTLSLRFPCSIAVSKES
jgi:hypothetical protein